MFAALRSRLPLWLQRLLLVLLALAFLWSAAMLWLPPLLKPQLERGLGEALGREVRVGEISFRPWSLELTLNDLEIAAQQPGEPPQLRVAQIYANAAAASIWRLAPVLDALSIHAPQVRLRQLAAGKHDIDDILARLATPADAPPGEPQAFALYNLQLSGGQIDLQDDMAGVAHRVRDLQLALPFISNFPADRETETLPRLAFRLNDSSFDSAAESTPFLESRRTAMQLRLRDLDIAPYLAYVPKDLPVQPKAGTLEADLEVDFEQTPQATVVLRGQVGLSGLQVRDGSDGELLELDRLRVDIAEARPLQRQVRLAAVEIQGPRLLLERDANGRLELLPPGQAAATPPDATAPAEPSAAQPWTLALAKASLSDGSIRWRDHAAAPGAAPAELRLEQLNVTLEDLAYPFEHPARLQGGAQLQGPADGAPATLSFEGGATDQQADLRVQLASLRLALAERYLAAFLKPRLDGELSAELALAWKAADGLAIDAERIGLASLALRPSGGSAQELRLLELRGARVDVNAQSVEIERLRVERPRLAAQRAKDGRWMFEDWLVDSPAQPAQPAADAKPWRVALRALELDEGTLAYADQSTPRPVALNVSGLRLRTGGFDSGQMQGRMPVELTASVADADAKASARGKPGRVSVRGPLAAQPLALQADLDLQQLPVHALEPYFGDRLNLQLTRADTSFAGKLQFNEQSAGPAVRLAGDLSVQDLRAHHAAAESAAERELLSWTSLRLSGLSLALAPGAATNVAVQGTTLTDFYARVVVSEQGRINLQDLVKPAPEEAAAAQAEGPAPNIRFGPIELRGGRVLFSDRFIKPNYTANLTELAGRLSAFDSAGAAGAQPAMADLVLSGRAEGTASLQVEGKLNPLADPLALDIRARVRDLELPPLSPYTVKYAGHGIQRGKLSVDVHYEVLPSGQLTASNKLVLNQLSFGDPVPGAPASLPVRLATALLADRNGVIDLDLPIQGSLNDPQFSLGPVIMKAIGNLILKAVTAPFSLLASAFGGGGEELGRIDFAAGSAELSAAAEERLAKVAQALTDRPALRLSVVGTADPQAEAEAFKRARLARMVQGEKRRQMLAAGQEVPERGAGRPPALEVGADEYPALLKAVYERTELPDKPRNAIGMTRSLPVPEMEALLLAAIEVSEEAMRNLAVQRSVAVRDHLAARQVPMERLFLGAPKLGAGEGGAAPHAELELATP